MPSKEYFFESIGTSITDYEDGRLKIVYGRPAHDVQEVLDQGEWIKKMIAEIYASHGLPLRILADLEKLQQVTLDDRSRALYREMMEQEYINKIAIVGDAFSFTKVMTLLLLLTGKRNRVRFFFNIAEARQWIGW